MIWPYLRAALAGSLAAVLAIASPARALTIEEALAEAARSSPYVRAARHAARANHEDVSFALSGWLSTVQVTANECRTYVNSH